MELLNLEIFISFMAIGFITWYGTGLDDLLFMSVVFKEKSHKQKVIMFFGNLAAVSVIVVLAGYLSRFSENLKQYPLALQLPGLIPIGIGLIEIKSLARKKRRKKIKKSFKNKKGIYLFSLAFFLYTINSIDDFVVTSSIFIANNDLIKIISYGLGFILGSAVSLYLASKFSKLTQKVSFLEFLAPVVIIAIGTLILSGFFTRH
ncbi:hypothetical protein BMS3Abin15_00783 [bacterium BMS3Abin15]|nr:hypothetical protein BMS3Abin15_00783 [bacterium BMS3Abin15]HDH07709.1 hypothetical protein [Candidatus Moranbacteria bacterium]HDZ84998.1 hypothetical protein [Candidatus Moranbacteria bacterium]